ncbi:MAG: helix-turn-helix transcriptional regulator [Bacteroidetes bacterium]|nr:helix-turn-helix transcriptional regulator [Bacteroidota bacterium]
MVNKKNAEKVSKIKTKYIFDIVCQANISKMNSLGEIFRKEREKRNLLLRQVAGSIDMDQAVLSKIERDERKPTKQQLIELVKFYKLDEKEIMVEWNSQKLVKQLKSEEYAIEILNQSIKKLKSKK